MQVQLSDAANRVTIPTLLVRGLKSDIVTEAGVARYGNAVLQQD
jgi:hypothetical protein